MKRTAIMLVMFGIVVAGSLSARADSGNPFGFETNKHPLEYEYCKKEPGLFRGHGYKCSSAPRPHPDLEEYKLQFVEDVGLCFIVGRHEGRLAGVIIDNFKGQIANKYGPPTAGDSFKQESPPLKFPTKYSWYPKAGFKGLGDVKAIEIGTNYNSSPKWVEIFFWLVPNNACQKKIDDKAAGAF